MPPGWGLNIVPWLNMMTLGFAKSWRKDLAGTRRQLFCRLAKINVASTCEQSTNSSLPLQLQGLLVALLLPCARFPASRLLPPGRNSKFQSKTRKQNQLAWIQLGVQTENWKEWSEKDELRKYKAQSNGRNRWVRKGYFLLHVQHSSSLSNCILSLLLLPCTLFHLCLHPYCIPFILKLLWYYIAQQFQYFGRYPAHERILTLHIHNELTHSHVHCVSF